MVRRLLVVYVLVLCVTLLWSRVEAATVPLSVGANVGVAAASTTGFRTVGSSVFTSGAFDSAMGASIGGRATAVPATWRLASNAGAAVLGLLRTTPTTAVASIAAGMLVTYGIKQCVTGSLGAWCVPGSPEQAPNGKPYPQSGGYWSIGSTWKAGTQQEACTMYAASSGVNMTYSGFRSVTTDNGYCQFRRASDNVLVEQQAVHLSNCASGHTLTNGTCYPPGYVAPKDERASTDADWSKVDANVLTASDVLLNQLTRDGAFLDIRPTFPATPWLVPLSDPYTDPVTGKRMRDIATVQPNPDGKTAEVQIAKQQVDAAGQPATDASGVAVAPQKQDDPCVGHEDRLGCMSAGQVPQGPDLGKDERTISITPDSGWGSDNASCPADLTTTLRQGGQMVAFSFKPVCDGADMFRPVVIGLAWIGAVLIALGVGRKGD